MLTWEYPPRIVGGIARHVEELSWALAEQGVGVDVVTCAFEDAPAEEEYRGVRVHRVEPYSPANDFVHWVHQLNAAMHDRAASLLSRRLKDGRAMKTADAQSAILLHSHDWVASFAGVRLKHAFRLPLMATIHATEHGRHGGLHNDLQRYIASEEQRLITEAWRVIVCSEFMRGEVQQFYGAPWDKVDVIPNGIRADKFAFDFPDEEARAFREQFAAPWEKLVVFSGRMVHEKGAHLLVEAVRVLRDTGVPAKLVIVGGGHRAHLEDQASRLGIAQNVYFTGFVPDDTLLRLYKVADAACFPSLYEPFGIVALEAMAAGAPVVVSDAGGLKEIVEHDRTGTVVWTGNLDSLVWGLRRVLTDQENARRMARAAREEVARRFSWGVIAEQTRSVYARVWGEYVTTDW